MLPLTVIQELQRRIALFEDMRAYEELYGLLFDHLHKFSFSIVRSSEAAEEIVSDVFIKLWQIRGRLNEIANLKVYLFTITKNFSINYIHRNYKNIPASMEEMEIEPVFQLDPEELLISAEIVNRIRQSIMSLPPQCRLIFQLVREDGLKYKEVAQILGLSPLTVRNQLTIAIRKIAAQLPDYAKPASIIPNFSAS
ncbi:MAG TPA: RNA polymerase sigma-70 factor [Chitinophagaceae bacterium]|nr:RNA polymerase sigma-70 factor [Chitinophagaceae bacterium]